MFDVKTLSNKKMFAFSRSGRLIISIRLRNRGIGRLVVTCFCFTNRKTYVLKKTLSFEIPHP